MCAHDIVFVKTLKIRMRSSPFSIFSAKKKCHSHTNAVVRFSDICTEINSIDLLTGRRLICNFYQINRKIVSIDYMDILSMHLTCVPNDCCCCCCKFMIYSGLISNRGLFMLVDALKIKR